MSKKQKGLGRGLDSLLGPSMPDTSPHGQSSFRVAPGGRGVATDGSAGSSAATIDNATTDNATIAMTGNARIGAVMNEAALSGMTPVPSDGLIEVSVDSLRAGRYQPRTRMDDVTLRELADSIREHGVLQPIIVRRIGDGGHEVIAGERRLRAARLAGLKTVPVLLRTVSDDNALALALIENIQREDLNPLEEAAAIRRLIDEFQFTHDRAAQSIGRSRSATSNLLRLLNLADHVQQMLMDGRLEMGHARCLLPLARADQIQVATHIEQKRLSVREAERLAQQTLAEAEAMAHEPQLKKLDRSGSQAASLSDPDVARLQERISERLGTRVELKARPGGKGRLVIHFGDTEAFSGLLERLDLASALDEESA